MEYRSQTGESGDRGSSDGYSDDGFEPVLSESSIHQADNAIGPAVRETENSRGDGYSDDGFETVQSGTSLNRDPPAGQEPEAPAVTQSYDSVIPPPSVPQPPYRKETWLERPVRPESPSATRPSSRPVRPVTGKAPLPPVSGFSSSRGRSPSKPSNKTNPSPHKPLPRKSSPRRAQEKGHLLSPDAGTSQGRASPTSLAPRAARPTTAAERTPGALKRLMSIENFPTIQPVSNRLLAERWEKKRFGLHQKALREAQATVDDSCPGSFGEWRTVNPKKVQIDKDRQSLIDHRNFLLLAKFEQVAEATHREYAANPQATQLRDTLSDRAYTRRLKQLHTIHAQNGTLLRRIDGKSSMYRVSSWTMERLQTLYYLINVSDHKSKYVQEMVRLSESLLATGQPLPPNIKAVVEPLLAAANSANGSSAGQHLPRLSQHKRPSTSSTRQSSAERSGAKSAGGSIRLQPIGLDGGPAEREGEGKSEPQEQLRVLEV